MITFPEEHFVWKHFKNKWKYVPNLKKIKHISFPEEHFVWKHFKNKWKYVSVQVLVDLISFQVYFYYNKLQSASDVNYHCNRCFSY